MNQILKIVRVIDNKPCYQLEKKLQNQFMRFSNVKFLTLNGVAQKSKVFYFNKIFTLEENLQKIKDFKIDFYLDLDVVFTKRFTEFLLNEFPKHKVAVGNVYYINWEYAGIDKVLPYIPEIYKDTIKDLFKTHKRYSTMLIPIKILEEFIKFLNTINYKEIVKKHYNKYLEEFLFSVFLHHKRLLIKRKEEFDLIWNLFLRKDNLAENEYPAGYFHLTTKEMLSYYKFFCKVDERYKKYLPDVIKIIKQLQQTKKYKN